jgi:hypothetical protein
MYLAGHPEVARAVASKRPDDRAKSQQKEHEMTHAIDGIAKPAGVDDEGRQLYLKDGKLLTDDELLAAVEKDYADEAEDVAFELEFAAHRLDDGSRSDDPKTLDYLRSIKVVDDDADSVDGVTAESAKVHLQAMQILKNEGKEDNYSADEYMLAVEQAQGAAA